MIKYNLILPIAICLSGCLLGQSRQIGVNNHAWLVSTNQLKFNNHIGLLLEGQLRRHELGISPQQTLLTTGLQGYMGAAAGTIGFSFIEMYPYGQYPVKAQFPEFRPWQQLQTKSQIGRIEYIIRLRQEQRFQKLPVEQANGGFKPGDAIFSHRSRILNRFSIPITAKGFSKHALYLSAYDEILIAYGKHIKANIFDQNRAYAAIGYVIKPGDRLEVGFLNQAVLKSDGVKLESNNTLVLHLMTTINLMHKEFVK